MQPEKYKVTRSDVMAALGCCLIGDCSCSAPAPLQNVSLCSTAELFIICWSCWCLLQISKDVQLEKKVVALLDLFKHWCKLFELNLDL